MVIREDSRVKTPCIWLDSATVACAWNTESLNTNYSEIAKQGDKMQPVTRMNTGGVVDKSSDG